MYCLFSLVMIKKKSNVFLLGLIDGLISHSQSSFYVCPSIHDFSQTGKTTFTKSPPEIFTTWHCETTL